MNLVFWSVFLVYRVRYSVGCISLWLFEFLQWHTNASQSCVWLSVSKRKLVGFLCGTPSVPSWSLSTFVLLFWKKLRRKCIDCFQFSHTVCTVMCKYLNVSRKFYYAYARHNSEKIAFMWSYSHPDLYYISDRFFDS